MTDRQPESGQGDFAKELDMALRHGGVSLAWLSQYLSVVGTPVTPAALSYWRTGRSRPRGTSLQAVASIENGLGLAPGHLLTHLGHPQTERPGHRGSHTARDLLAAIATLDANRFSSLRDIHLDAIWLTEHRAASTDPSWVEHLFAGHVVRGPVTRIPVFAWGDPEPGPALTHLEPLFGALLDEPISDEQARLMVAYLLVDRPLEVGESVIFGFVAHYGPSHAEHESLERRLPDAVDAVVLELAFDVLPREVSMFFADDLGRHTQESIIEPINGSITASFVNAPIGQAGLHWVR